jgi:ABC-type nitrate/sulfonate/bicarbonate transport system permease component
MKVLSQQIGVGAALVLVWALADAAGLVNHAVLPPVGDVARELVVIWSTPEFIPSLFGTLRDAIFGILVAAIIAIPLGIIIGMFGAVERSARTLLDFGRSFPVVALLPILVLVIGATHGMKVVAIGIACFFPILLQTIYGARRIEPTILDTVRSFRIPFHLRFFRVILPSAAPYIATGIRIAAAVSILVAVGTEVIIPIVGLGEQITILRNAAQVAPAFAYVIYAGLLGLLLTTAWEYAESRLLAWNRRAKAD